MIGVGGDKGPGAPTDQAILKKIGYVRVLWKPQNDRGDTEALTWQSLELLPCLPYPLKGSEMALKVKALAAKSDDLS